MLAESYKSGQEKESALKKFLSQRKGTSIVYVQTHKVGRSFLPLPFVIWSSETLISNLKQTEDVCACLRKVGINAYGYHAGMQNEARTNIQEKFMRTKDIVVSSILFADRLDTNPACYEDSGNDSLRNGN